MNTVIWTEEKKNVVKQLFDEGRTRKEIATLFNTTYKAIDSLITREGWKRKAAEKELEKELSFKNEIAIRDEQIKGLLKRDKLYINDFYGKVFRFGVVSDTHFGSLQEKKTLLKSAYEYFKKENIAIVYHCGDLIEGEKMFKGQEYERYITGCDNLIQNVVNEYPKIEGITTYFITGSHDLSYFKEVGTDVGKRISEKRADLKYLGQDEADIRITPGVIIRLAHPGGGTSYAISYNVQKYIESLSGGQKPTIILFGHYHKAEYLPSYRNTFAIQAGCFQGQTTFMKRKRLAAHMGFWVCEAMINKERTISRFKAEFIAFYEQSSIYEPTEKL